MDLLVEVLVVMLVVVVLVTLPMLMVIMFVCVCDIRLSKKYRRRLVTAAIAKSPGVSWRSSKKFNDRK